MTKTVTIALPTCCGSQTLGMVISKEPSPQQGVNAEKGPFCYGCRSCAMEEGRAPSRCQQCCSEACYWFTGCTSRSASNCLRETYETIAGLCCCGFLPGIPAERRREFRKANKFIFRRLCGIGCSTLITIPCLFILLKYSGYRPPPLPTPTPLTLPWYLPEH